MTMRYTCGVCGYPEACHKHDGERADRGDADYQCPTGRGFVCFGDFTLKDGPTPVHPPAPTRRMIYIAGPISRGDLAHNLTQATAAFVKLANAGLAPLCPHWSAFSGPLSIAPTSGAPYAFATPGGCGLSHADWLAVDLAFVERSCAVLRLPGESKGADMEVAHARARGIPVFEDADCLIRTMREGEPAVPTHDLGGEG